MARFFDGVSDQISYPRPTQVDGATQLTVLFNWLQPGAVNNYAAVLSWLDGSLRGFYISHEQAIAGFIRVLIGNAGGYAVASWGGLSGGAVGRVAVVFDGSLSGANRVAVYVNGSPPGTFITSSSWPADAGTSAVSTLILGGADASVGSGHANIDSFSEVAIFTRVLTADEIVAHGAGYSPGALNAAGRVFYDPLIRDPRDLHGAVATVTGTTVVTHPRLVYGRGGHLAMVPSVGVLTGTSTAAVATWVTKAATATPGAAPATSTAAVATWSTVAATATPGAVPSLSTAAVATWTTRPATATPGAMPATSVAAVATWVAVPATASAGAVSALATVALATWVTVPAMATAGSNAAVSMAASATWVTPPATATPGAVTALATAATATWTTRPATATASGTPALSTVAVVTWGTRPATAAPGAALASSIPALATWVTRPATAALPGAQAAISTAAVVTWVTQTLSAANAPAPCVSGRFPIDVVMATSTR